MFSILFHVIGVIISREYIFYHMRVCEILSAWKRGVVMGMSGN